ncbi:MAG: hypothetical protein JXA25_20075 [Anaerolineales bacterium]|nr:hypothetical protein [Anaerolineales bacterium]
MASSGYQTRVCPQCGVNISASSSTCSACGSTLSAAEQIETPSAAAADSQQEQMAPQSPKPEKPAGSRSVKILAACAVVVVICFCCIVLAGLGATVFRRDVHSLLYPSDIGGLKDVVRAPNGTVTGTYMYPYSLDYQNVQFSVTADGRASIFLEGAAESERLEVVSGGEQDAEMLWQGSSMDGYGGLDPAEEVILEEIMNGDLEYAVNEIALDLGCLDEETITPDQVAALLFPLQMKFKYLVSDRQAAAQSVAVRSDCRYHAANSGTPEVSSVIELNAANPVPVVFGYFPFDDEGALEPAVSLPDGVQLACLGMPSGKPADLSPLEPGSFASAADPALMDEYGACGAMCRGACGPDCIESNCTLNRELRCEEDDQGRYTGTVMQILSYTCGMAQGCIDHDACYDSCNEAYGCSTWSATFCRHGQVTGATATYEGGYCDQRAIEEHGYTNSLLWMRGYGIQPMTETFEYTDTDFVVYEDFDLCPVDEKQPVEKPENESEEPAAQETQDDSPAVPPVEPTQEEPVSNDSDRADVHPCDLFPPGGENVSRGDTTCFASYETGSGDLSIQISKYPPNLDVSLFCPIEVDPGFAITLSTLDIGDCATLVRRGVDGTPDTLGYVGWDIYAVIYPYNVRVGTHEVYPGNESNVYDRMYELEGLILNP